MFINHHLIQYQTADHLFNKTQLLFISMALPNPQNQLTRYSKQLVFSSPIETPSKNTYQFGKIEVQKNNNQWPIQYMLKTIKEVEITQNIKNRLNRIRQLPQHDNVVPVKAKGYKPQQKQVLILSDYFRNAESLENIVKNKQNLKSSQINQIFYQVIVAMAFLQQNGLNHLRLNPSSILVKFSSYQQSKPVIRICDVGVCHQNQYFYQWCLHKDLFQQKTVFDPYNNLQVKDCVKYDLWALGSIIYYVLKQRQPFSGVESQFPFVTKTLTFKKKHALNPQQWFKKYNDDFPNDYLFQKLLIKCWGLNNQPSFKSWYQAQQFYQSKINYKAIRMQKMGINAIYTNHIRFIFLFSKIYILLREEAQFKTSVIWLKKKKQQIMQNQECFLMISFCMFKICDFCHCNDFQRYFKHRCSILSFHHERMLEKMTQFIQNEREFLKNSSIIKEKEISFQKIIRNIPKPIIKIKSLFQEKKEYIQSSQINLLDKFMNQFLVILQKYKTIQGDCEKDRFESFNLFYASLIFKQIAVKQFGFQIPTYNLFKLDH